VVCQYGEHGTLLCGLHGARLKGSAFLPEPTPSRQAERHDSHKRHKEHKVIHAGETLSAKRLQFEFANLETVGTEVDEEATCHARRAEVPQKLRGVLIG
jgi:hypothetical protein